jgi:hypothetical protein
MKTVERFARAMMHGGGRRPEVDARSAGKVGSPGRAAAFVWMDITSLLVRVSIHRRIVYA